MDRKNQANPIHRFFTSRLFLLVTLPLAGLVVLGYVRSYYSDYKLNREIAALQSEIKSLEKKKLESMEILRYVMSPDFVEEKARVELNMKRPGERVLIIQNNVSDNLEWKIAAPTLDHRQKSSNPLKWWYYFR